MTDISRAASSILFPVSADLALSDQVLRFLDGGGRALLFGETGENTNQARYPMHEQRDCVRPRQKLYRQ